MAVTVQLLQFIALLCSGSMALANSLNHHRAARSVPAINRYMVVPTHFGEYCAEGNCSAAHITTSSSGGAANCKLMPSRAIDLDIGTQNVDIHNSPLLYPDEKTYYITHASRFFSGYSLTSAQSQFTSQNHRYDYYDPTRFPPIYSNWQCAHKQHGTSSCTLPSSSNATASVNGVCRHVCDKRLVLRLVRRDASCKISSVRAGSYVWAWCLESTPVSLYCAPEHTPDDQSCSAEPDVSKSCNIYDSFYSP